MLAQLSSELTLAHRKLTWLSSHMELLALL